MNAYAKSAFTTPVRLRSRLNRKRPGSAEPLTARYVFPLLLESTERVTADQRRNRTTSVPVCPSEDVPTTMRR